MTSLGRTKTRVGLGVGAITAGKGPAELSSQDGGARGLGISGMWGEEGRQGSWAKGTRGLERLAMGLESLGPSPAGKRVSSVNNRSLWDWDVRLWDWNSDADHSLLLRAVRLHGGSDRR